MSKIQHNERLNIILELLETEENYTEQLGLIDVVYAKGLRDSLENDPKPIINKDHYVKIFGSILVIHELNLKLFDALKLEREEDKKGMKRTKSIGQIFLEFAPQLKIYTVFCQEFDNVSKLVSELRQKAAFDDYLYDRKYAPENKPKYSIESYLILPVQRIPRYELLLRDLLKKTSKYHSDYELLQKSLDQIQVTANYVNENLALFKSREKMREISRKMLNVPENFSIVQPYRRLNIQMKFERLFVCPPSSSSSPSSQEIEIITKKEEIIFFLFSDLLIIGVEKKEKKRANYVWVCHYDLEKNPFCWIYDVKDFKTKMDEEVKNVFLFVTEDETYNLFCSSEEEKLEFYLAFHKTMDLIVSKVEPKTLQRSDIITRKMMIQKIEDENFQKKKVNNEKRKKSILKMNTKINPKFTLKYQNHPKRDVEFLSNEEIEEFQKVEYSDALSFCRSNVEYQENEESLPDEIFFKKNDLFMVIKKDIKIGNQIWYVVSKLGLNCDDKRKIEKEPMTHYKLIKDEMMQQIRLKSIPPIYKKMGQKIPINKQPLSILSFTENQDGIERQFESLKDISFNSPNISKSPSMTKLKNSFLKGHSKSKSQDKNTSSEPILVGDIIEVEFIEDYQTDEFWKNVTNCNLEKGECGLIPLISIFEYPKELEEKILMTLDERDEMEEKKIRNFKLKHKKTHVEQRKLKLEKIEEEKFFLNETNLLGMEILQTAHHSRKGRRSMGSDSSYDYKQQEIELRKLNDLRRASSSSFGAVRSGSPGTSSPIHINESVVGKQRQSVSTESSVSRQFTSLFSKFKKK
eukprot:gene2556-3518_t